MILRPFIPYFRLIFPIMKSNAVDVPADPVEEPTAPLNSSTNSSDDDGGPVLLILEEQKVRFKLKIILLSWLLFPVELL